MSEGKQPVHRPRNLVKLLFIGTVVLLIVGSLGIATATFASKSNPVTAAKHQPTPTKAPGNKNPYPPNTGTLALNDALKNNSKGYGWEVSNDGNGNICSFTNGVYQVQAHAYQTTSSMNACIENKKTFSNFAFEVHAKVTKVVNLPPPNPPSQGCAALLFRYTRPAVHTLYSDTFYTFTVCPDGHYVLSYARGYLYPMASGQTRAIHQGLNQDNVLGLVANGTKFDLYINYQLVKKVLPSHYTRLYAIGDVGFGATSDMNTVTTQFSNTRLWTF
ncbi:MAG TPA: hypothetical protein VKR06_16985 [Ktedonosporobacter sp.]|nr:hypothetical protein [Ktedonosporobacter sp.]